MKSTERSAAPGGSASHRVEVSLVELVHGSLQLAALALPLLKVADRFHGGTLPRGGAGVVVNVVDPAPVVHPALPAVGLKKRNPQTKKKNHFKYFLQHNVIKL